MSIRNLYIKRSGQRVKHHTSFAFLLLCLTISSCKKLVEIPPPTQSLTDNKIYTTDATAIGVLNGIYSNLTMGNSLFQGTPSIGLMAGLSADELNIFGTSNPYYAYFRNDLAMLTNGFELWGPLYNNVYKCNAATEGL